MTLSASCKRYTTAARGIPTGMLETKQMTFVQTSVLGRSDVEQLKLPALCFGAKAARGSQNSHKNYRKKIPGLQKFWWVFGECSLYEDWDTLGGHSVQLFARLFS